MVVSFPEGLFGKLRADCSVTTSRVRFLFLLKLQIGLVFV